MKEKENALQREFKHKDHVDDEDISKITWAFVNRKRFKYTISNILLYVLTCVCLRNKNRNRKDPRIKPHFLLAKAEDKFMNDLDAIRIVRTLRKFKMLAQALLSQKHRLILKFQRANLVETESSSSDSDENTYDTLRLMENKNPHVKMGAFARVKKMVKGLARKDLDPLERNLIRGLFVRKLKDFAEDQAEFSKTTSLYARIRPGANQGGPQDLEHIAVTRKEDPKLGWGSGREQNATINMSGPNEIRDQVKPSVKPSSNYNAEIAYVEDLMVKGSVTSLGREKI